ncbi:APHP domain-containing protein [Methanococcus maripaludis X1]|uniref:APHP domain-containing protein n=1 Tax=Methanococcus maripaludis X1 TaxID=1053692 RepID=G0H4S1_METMI|nr:CARDB domain-containing protein [Methanococcus maripaludis]AEK19702.1 APHP domain-containing protein [Methanococcus maripaludis X1]
MKFKLIVTSILALLALNACFATSVELNSSSLNVEKGDTFSLDLLIKDAPETWAIENGISYDEDIINLTSITLSEICNAAPLKEVSPNGDISLAWFSDAPSGNFTVATLSFETLNRGNTQIELNPSLSDTDGYALSTNVTNTNVSVYEPKPDLVITNVSIDPLKKYETNTVLVTVKNNGDFNASAFKVSLDAVTGVIDSDVEESVAGLNYGENTVVTFENITLGPNNLFDIIVDSEYAVEESDEINNEISFGNQPLENSISAVLSCENDSVKTGETFDVALTLNDLTANRPAKAVEGALVFDSVVLECSNFEFQLDALEANETYLENITINSDNVTFSIVDGTIDENTIIAIATFEALAVGNSDISLENLVVSDVNGYAFNNVNETETNMIVQGPDVSVENVEVSNPYYMEPATIKVTVANNGHQTVESCSVNVYIDSDELKPLTVTDLGVGESKIVEFNWTPQKSKTFTVVTVLDSSDAISEENETNNQHTEQITVTERTVSMEIYKKSETENQTVASVKVSGMVENRPCKGYDVYVSLDNLEVVEVNAIGETTNWSITNNTLFITGYEFNEYDEFEIANITFNKTNNSISAIISECALSDSNGYAFNEIFTSNKIVNLKSIENIVVDSNVSDLVNESALETVNNGEFNITKIYFNNSDSIWIPETVENISFTNETLDAMNEAVSNLENIDFDSITSENDVSDIMDEVINNTVVVSNYGFDISNITQETAKDGNNAISELRFTATNTSSKGFAIIRLPVGNLEISEIIVNNGTDNITLEKDNIESTIGGYRLPVDGILEITLIKDPEVTITFSSALPQTTSSSSSSHGGGGGSSYSSDIADDIESKVIKNFVSSATVIYGNEIDENYANQLRERVQNAEGFTISGNAVIVGGPLANGFAKEYNDQFEMPISNDYPGENKGVIQVLKVQDNSGNIVKSYTIVYIAGSDRYGTLAALEYFKTLDELPEGPIMVEWTANGSVVVEELI